MNMRKQEIRELASKIQDKQARLTDVYSLADMVLMDRKKDIKKEIRNFIQFWSSDKEERQDMYEVLNNYIHLSEVRK